MNSEGPQMYSYTLGTPRKRVHEEITSPSDAANDPPTSRLKEYTSPGDIASPTGSTSLNPTGFTGLNPSMNYQLSDSITLKDQVKSALCDPCVMKTICDNVCSAFKEMLGPLTDSIKEQTKSITELTAELAKQNKSIECLKVENFRLKHRVELAEETIESLETKLDNLEQYGRRNSVRFVNVNKEYLFADTNENESNQFEPESDTVTIQGDECEHASSIFPPNSNQIGDKKRQKEDKKYKKIAVDICNNKINVTPPISENDIERVHPIGQEKEGRIQILCKFKHIDTKVRVFTQKRNLKSKKSDSFKVFLTEDLTKKRQRIVSALNDARKDGVIHTYWTSDGRIFYKKTATSNKVEIKEINDKVTTELYNSQPAWASHEHNVPPSGPPRVPRRTRDK